MEKPGISNSEILKILKAVMNLYSSVNQHEKDIYATNNSLYIRNKGKSSQYRRAMQRHLDLEHLADLETLTLSTLLQNDEIEPDTFDARTHEGLEDGASWALCLTWLLCTYFLPLRIVGHPHQVELPTLD